MRLPDDARPPSIRWHWHLPARDAVWWYFVQRSSLSTAAPRSLTTGNSVSQSHIRKVRSTARLLTIIQSTSRRPQWTRRSTGGWNPGSRKSRLCFRSRTICWEARVCRSTKRPRAWRLVASMSPVTPICTRSAQVVNVEHGSPALLCFVNGRQLRLIEPDSVGRGREVNSLSWSPRQWRMSNGPAVWRPERRRRLCRDRL